MPRRNQNVQDQVWQLYSPLSRTLNLHWPGYELCTRHREARRYIATINGHCRTRVFEFPEIGFQPDEDEPHYTIRIPPRASVCRCRSSALLRTFSEQLRVSVPACGIWSAKQIRSQQKGRKPVFLVVEESGHLEANRDAKGRMQHLGRNDGSR